MPQLSEGLATPDDWPLSQSHFPPPVPIAPSHEHAVTPLRSRPRPICPRSLRKSNGVFMPLATPRSNGCRRSPARSPQHIDRPARHRVHPPRTDSRKATLPTPRHTKRMPSTEGRAPVRAAVHHMRILPRAVHSKRGTPRLGLPSERECLSAAVRQIASPRFPGQRCEASHDLPICCPQQCERWPFPIASRVKGHTGIPLPSAVSKR